MWGIRCLPPTLVWYSRLKPRSSRVCVIRFLRLELAAPVAGSDDREISVVPIISESAQLHYPKSQDHGGIAPTVAVLLATVIAVVQHAIEPAAPTPLPILHHLFLLAPRPPGTSVAVPMPYLSSAIIR